MSSSNDLLKAITHTLLFKPDQYKELLEGVHQLHKLYAECTGIAAYSVTDKDMWLPSGNAVSPIKAAHCLLEFQRTAVFLRGIYKALLRLQRDFPGEQLHILYAGCGPYATLVTPLTSMFTAAEITFHLVDVNPVSLDSAKRLYTAWHLDAYVAEYILTDATTYRFPADGLFHLVISETMLNALRKEPQVDIMLNLLPQLHPKAIFVPYAITVSAWLLDCYQESSRHLHPDKEPDRISLGMLYRIGREEYEPHEKTILQIPEALGTCNSLHLLTHINTFEDEVLDMYDSSLNLPLRIGEMNGYAGKKVAFTYQRGEKPGFIHEWE